MLQKGHCLFRLLLLVFLTSPPAITAQGQTPQFRAGDRVLASPSMLKDEKYYRPCTVVKFDRSANAYLLDCEGAEYTVTPDYVRAAKNQTSSEENEPAVVEKPKGAKAKPDDNAGQFKVGDRVLASVSGLKGDKYYQPCTVIRGLKDNSYGLRCDPRNGQPVMEYSVRPEWIKLWENATPEPLPAECPFNKNYGKVSNKAAASAELFKSVIFEWQRSSSDFYDFGLTFLNFQIGTTFKNAATGRGRKLVDTAPVGATIHPVKAKELICQKSSTITKRWVRDIEYACYKSEYGEWVCKNGAPKYVEQTSIPNR
ncbi:MAG TPA: hypothetical protein VE262_02220 [Blastocatellia bacterium]|nr:hypothetical protein [Blastocatellia bacterium]